MIDAKARLTQLQKDYENLLIEQQDALSNAKTGIITLESKLSLAKDELTYAQNNTTDTTTLSTVQQGVTDGYTLIESAYDSIYPSLNTLSEVMIFENKDNPQYWAIGENNQALKTQIDDLYKKAKQARIDIEPKFLAVKNNSSSLTSVLVGLTEMQSLLGEVRTLTTLSIASVRASRVGAEINETLVGLKITKLTTLSTELSIQYADMEATIKTLKNVDNTSLADLGTANTIKSKQLSVDGLQSDIIKAKQNLIQTIGAYESKILSAKQSMVSQENTITLAEATYNELINGTSTDIVSARNSVRSAEISLEKANLTLRDYQIIATFDGIVNHIPWII
jgi:multidrug resistance efflux pump